MRKIAWLIVALVMLTALGGAAQAAKFKLIGVQTDRVQVGRSVNRKGHQIRICIQPTACKRSKNKKATIQIGITAESRPKRNAVETWALYE